MTRLYVEFATTNIILKALEDLGCSSSHMRKEGQRYSSGSVDVNASHVARLFFFHACRQVMVEPKSVST